MEFGTSHACFQASLAASTELFLSNGHLARNYRGDVTLGSLNRKSEPH